MSRVLIVTTDGPFSSRLASALRSRGYSVMIQNDMIDGMRELYWFDAKLIICEVQLENTLQKKACSLLLKRFKGIPLILVQKNMESVQEFKQDGVVIVQKSSSIEDFTQKVEKLIGVPLSLSDIA